MNRIEPRPASTDELIRELEGKRQHLEVLRHLAAECAALAPPTPIVVFMDGTIQPRPAPDLPAELAAALHETDRDVVGLEYEIAVRLHARVVDGARARYADDYDEHVARFGA